MIKKLFLTVFGTALCGIFGKTILYKKSDAKKFKTLADTNES